MALIMQHIEIGFASLRRAAGRRTRRRTVEPQGPDLGELFAPSVPPLPPSIIHPSAMITRTKSGGLI